MKFQWRKFVFVSLLFASVVSTLGCGIAWFTFGNKNSGSPLQTYEYIYLGDTGNSSFLGYSINTVSGVLTAISSSPSEFVYSMALGKIAGDFQILAAAGVPTSAYLISPTTGVLNPVSASSFPGTNAIQQSVFSPSGLSVYAVDSPLSNPWSATVSPTTGNFSNAVSAANFSAPITAARSTLLSPNGNFVYFIDANHSAIEGYSTAGSTLTVVAGANTGTGVNTGDKTYGLTLLPTPNAGAYDTFAPIYLDAGANVIFLYFRGNAGNNNWIMPYKINNDGSLSTGAALNLGLPAGGSGDMVGDSTGKYLFANVYNGINTYAIGVNGALTLSSGPVFAGQGFANLTINSENTLIYGNGANLVTASLVLATGILTPVSSVADPCGNNGPMALDPNESFIYAISYPVSPNTICGFMVSSSGVIGAIAGQTYPLTVTGSVQTLTSLIVRVTSP